MKEGRDKPDLAKSVREVQSQSPTPREMTKRIAPSVIGIHFEWVLRMHENGTPPSRWLSTNDVRVTSAGILTPFPSSVVIGNDCVM